MIIKETTGWIEYSDQKRSLTGITSWPEDD